MKKKIINSFMATKEWLTAHPFPIIIVAMVIAIIIDLSYAVINFLSVKSLVIAYVAGLVLIIPALLIVIVINTSKSKKKEANHQKEIKDSDKEISRLRKKLKDGKDAVEKGKKDSRSYESLKKQVASERTTHQETVETYEKYIAYFSTLYDRDEFPRKVCNFVAFAFSYVDALELFDPVLYLSDKIYAGWVNSNVKSWNQIIEEYDTHPQMAINKIKNSQNSTRPKKMSSDSSPMLEKEKDVESRPKKLSNISLDDGR